MIKTGSHSLNKVLNNDKRAVTISLGGGGFGVVDANWEVYYDGYWRDVRDDWEWDYTKDGFKILRAQHFDDGAYRTYRDDRGLILREKEDDEEEKTKENIFEVTPSVFFKSAMEATAVGLGMKTFDRIIEPKIFSSNLWSKFMKKSPTMALATKSLMKHKWSIISAGANIFATASKAGLLGAAATGAEVGIGAIIGRLAQRAPVVGPIFTALRIGYMAYQGMSIPNAILSEVGINIVDKISSASFDYFENRSLSSVIAEKTQTSPINSRNRFLAQTQKQYFNISRSFEYMPTRGVRLRNRYFRNEVSEITSTINRNAARYYNIKIIG